VHRRSSNWSWKSIKGRRRESPVTGIARHLGAFGPTGNSNTPLASITPVSAAAGQTCACAWACACAYPSQALTTASGVEPLIWNQDRSSSIVAQRSLSRAPPRGWAEDRYSGLSFPSCTPSSSTAIREIPPLPQPPSCTPRFPMLPTCSDRFSIPPYPA